MHLDGYAVLYRPGIDGDGAEIPDTRHIGALVTPVTVVTAGRSGMLVPTPLREGAPEERG